jgi:alpha-tubulin suppressor-like RCC1 family protein
VTTLNHINVGLVAAGQYHSLCTNSLCTQLYSWGCDKTGQLGLGGTETLCRSTPTLVQFPAPGSHNVHHHVFQEIACGGSTSMALTIDHGLYTWGSKGLNGHEEYNNKDLRRPKKLDVDKILKENVDTDANDGTDMVYKIGGGITHSVLLVQRQANNNSS